jgi:hypothetical protein
VDEAAQFAAAQNIVAFNYLTVNYTAILILRFHDIKTLAPRGVNNS